MATTKAQLEQIVVEKLSACHHKPYTVDAGHEPYQLYNDLVGTTFDETSYNTLAESEEGIQYLVDHIPGGYKFAKLETEGEEGTTEGGEGTVVTGEGTQGTIVTTETPGTEGTTATTEETSGTDGTTATTETPGTEGSTEGSEATVVTGEGTPATTETPGTEGSTEEP